MPIHRWFNRGRPDDGSGPATAASRPPSRRRPDPDTKPEPEPPREPDVPGRPVGVWAAIAAGVLLAAVLIVFLLSNTDPVEVAFLGFKGELPLAIALLIAVIAGTVIALVLAAARATRLRYQARRGRCPPAPP